MPHDKTGIGELAAQALLRAAASMRCSLDVNLVPSVRRRLVFVGVIHTQIIVRAKKLGEYVLCRGNEQENDTGMVTHRRSGIRPCHSQNEAQWQT